MCICVWRGVFRIIINANGKEVFGRLGRVELEGEGDAFILYGSYVIVF